MEGMAKNHRSATQPANCRLRRRHRESPCVSIPLAPRMNSTWRCLVKATTCKRSSKKSHQKWFPKSSTPPIPSKKGRELRLIQEYFLVACALEDIFKTYLASHDTFDAFPDQVWPSSSMIPTRRLAVAELMRRLIDDHDLPWTTSVGHHPSNPRVYQPHTPCPKP